MLNAFYLLVFALKMFWDAFQSVSGPLVACKPAYHVHVAVVTYNPSSIPSTTHHTHTTSQMCSCPPAAERRLIVPHVYLKTATHHAFDCPHCEISSCLQVYTGFCCRVGKEAHACFSYYRHHFILWKKKYHTRPTVVTAGGLYNKSHQSAQANYYLALVLSVFKCALVNTVQLET